jgi:hypothetical protein
LTTIVEFDWHVSSSFEWLPTIEVFPVPGWEQPKGLARVEAVEEGVDSVVERASGRTGLSSETVVVMSGSQ